MKVNRVGFHGVSREQPERQGSKSISHGAVSGTTTKTEVRTQAVEKPRKGKYTSVREGNDISQGKERESGTGMERNKGHKATEEWHWVEWNRGKHIPIIQQVITLPCKSASEPATRPGLPSS